MAKYKPWLKMWVEWIDDLKMLDLTLAEQGAWWRLVTLAQKCAADGALIKHSGTPYSLDEIASTLRISPGADRDIFDSMLKKMSEQGSLHWNDVTLIITNFKKRQETIASETREAVRERVRRHRERKAGVTEKPLPQLSGITPSPPQELEAEAEAHNSLRNDRYSNGKIVTLDPALAKIATLHEQFFGILTPNLAEKFKDFVEHYPVPLDWIDKAFTEAVQLNNRRWEYVGAILKNWLDKGGPHADRRERGRARQEQNQQVRPTPARRRPITYIPGAAEE